MKNDVENALGALVGLPLSDVSRGANMLMFGFGGPRLIPAHSGGTREVGDFALHVQCAWRFRDSSRILIGFNDIYYPADLPWTEPIPDGFDWDVSGANRCDRFFKSFMAAHKTAPIRVISAVADDVGGFHLGFSDGYELDVFPDTGMPNEVWRLFRPCTSGHFVLPHNTPDDPVVAGV